jgi:hypothetical protein
LFDDIGTETGTLVHPKDARYTADHAADHAAYNRAHWASRSFSVPCTPLDSTGDALGLAYNWKKHRSHNGSSADKTTDHGDSLWDEVRRQAVGGEKVPSGWVAFTRCQRQ